MSAFGIFAAILTFVYVIYYAVMISMDLFGNKSQQKDNVEVIASLDNKHNEEVVDETPTFVDEEGATDYNPQNEMLAFCKTKCSIRKTKRIFLRVPSYTKL